MADQKPEQSTWFTPRTIAFVVCVVVTSVILFALKVLVASENRLFISELRSHVLNHAGIVRAELEGELNSELLLTRGLVTEISGSPNITEERFADVAEDFHSISSHIRNIGFAKGLVLTYVYPKAGNESAVGLVYNENPNQWPAVKKAINTRQTIIAGPLEVVQGGKAIISRTPIFVPPGVDPDEQTYYGIVSMVINADSLLNAAGIDEHPDIRIALRGKDGLGSEGKVFSGDPAIFEMDPVILNIKLPNGQWQLAASPIDGWNASAPLVKTHQTVATITAAFMVLAIVLVTIEFERRKKLEQEQAKLITELQTAIQEVRTLSGLLPICASCKNVRDDKGYWQQIEGYFNTRADVQFSHGICPTCIEKLYPDYSDTKKG